MPADTVVDDFADNYSLGKNESELKRENKNKIAKARSENSCQKNGSLVLVGRRRLHKIQIQVNEVCINSSSPVKYLGVWFDRNNT